MRFAPLRHKTIVITRPKEQAEHLAELIQSSGGEALIFPAIEIRDPAETETLDARIDRLDDFDLAIFISPTAVTKAMERVSQRRALPSTLKIAAIGQGSARELNRLGVNDVLVPATRFDSEALLDLPAMQQMRGKRVIIFRGEGGRALLAETLKKRGATVDYAECYRRACPDTPVSELLQRGWKNEIHGIVITSSEGMHNLHDMIGESGAAWLKSTPVFVSHPKIEQVGRKLGLTRLIVAEGGDEAMLQSIIDNVANSS
ncbi:MAG: uroporphyrinogen-III synthase [Thiobacillaceae bacterium]